jgi:transposase
MPRALSVDLRVRVLAAVAQGWTHREAGERFGVSAASVSRWRQRTREAGDARPKALGGDRRSGRIEAHAATILAILDEAPDITIEELRRRLTDIELVFGGGTLRRFFIRHRITRKKTAHASEQDRPDVLKQREAWFAAQLDLDPERLVFIDETPASAGAGSGPRPTWPAVTAAAGAASDSRSAFPTATGRPPPSLPALPQPG